MLDKALLSKTFTAYRELEHVELVLLVSCTTTWSVCTEHRLKRSRPHRCSGPAERTELRRSPAG